MFKCFECGHIFEHGEEQRIVEPHGEEYLACPICGNAYEETVQCKKCGSHQFDDELYSGWCEECLGEKMNLHNMAEYLKDNNLEADFYIGEFYKSNFDYASPELIDLARRGFNHAAFSGVLDRMDAKGNLPNNYEAKQIALLRKFVVNDGYGMYDFAEWLNKKEENK